MKLIQLQRSTIQSGKIATPDFNVNYFVFFLDGFSSLDQKGYTCHLNEVGYNLISAVSTSVSTRFYNWFWRSLGFLFD